jgi:cytochrome c oxidase assembly protein subunit 15
VCAATVVLLIAGALVTSTGSSLAVPDWPLAYGRLFPPMVGGILYEHGHRMIAAMVGLLTVILALATWRLEPRRWVRVLAWSALGLVVFQGMLGGITVLLLLPKSVSISHALFAQLFFCTAVVLVQVTAPGWPRLVGQARGRHAVHALALARLGAVTVAALLVQLLLGATVRHNNAGLAIPDFPLAYGGLVPPLDSFPVVIHFLHRLGALAVLGLVGLPVWRAVRSSVAGASSLRVPAVGMAILVIVQILLGGSVIWSQRAVAATTVHLVVGALLLGATVWLTTRAFALTGGFGPGRRWAR